MVASKFCGFLLIFLQTVVSRLVEIKKNPITNGNNNLSPVNAAEQNE